MNDFELFVRDLCFWLCTNLHAQTGTFLKMIKFKNYMVNYCSILFKATMMTNDLPIIVALICHIHLKGPKATFSVLLSDKTDFLMMVNINSLG